MCATARFHDWSQPAQWFTVMGSAATILARGGTLTIPPPAIQEEEPDVLVDHPAPRTESQSDLTESLNDVVDEPKDVLC